MAAKSTTPAQRKAVAIKDRSVQAAIRELREIGKARAELDERRKALELKVKHAMADAEEATVGGVKVATYVTSIRSSLSATLVKKAYPEVAAECTVMTEVRTFKIHDPE
jgi:predicted phage-related endonuclease